MLRYKGKKRRDYPQGVIHLPMDIWVDFTHHNNIEVLHKVGKILSFLYDNRTDYQWCRHRLPNPKSRQELHEFFKRIRPRFRYEHEWADLRKEFTSFYYAPRPKYWNEVLPDKVVLWASRRLAALQGKEACVDNFRVARVGNTCQERRYRRQVKDGCCGFMDIIEICPHDGHAYRLGFNYGH